MSTKSFLSIGIFSALLALSACTTDEGTTGLLNLDGSTDDITVEDATLRIVGPGGIGSGGIAVTALCTQSGFFAELLDGNQKPIEDTFIRIVTALGTVRAATGNSGSGAVTDSNGRARFVYTAPGNVTTNDFDELEAFTGLQDPETGDNVSIESDPYEIEVVPGPRPELTLSGPGVASGSLEVPSGGIARGFIARVRPGDNCQPREDQQITITTSPANQGSINAPPEEVSTGGGLTDSAGQLEFDFVAPENITEATSITLTATVDVARQRRTANYILRVLPPVLRLTGPADAFPGEERTGFRLQLTRSDGQAIPNERVDLTASQGTIEHIRNNNNQRNLETDSFGIINFSYTPPANIASTTNVTITANAFDLGITQTLSVAVRPDRFTFSSPTANTAINVGVANAAELIFRWTNAAGTGVAGTVNLSSSSSDARFLVNSDVESRGVRQVSVETDTTGAFKVPVKIFSNFSEFVTITATSAENTQLRATIPIQFVDQPGSNPDSVLLVATPTEVDATTNPGATADVVFSVTNSANEPIDGINVVFEIVGGSSHPNEEIFPIGGTTRQGEARSTYYTRPGGTGTVQSVTLRACIEGGSLCDDFVISVQ